MQGGGHRRLSVVVVSAVMLGRLDVTNSELSHMTRKRAMRGSVAVGTRTSTSTSTGTSTGTSTRASTSISTTPGARANANANVEPEDAGRRTTAEDSIGGTMIQTGNWGSCQSVGASCLKFRAVLCLDPSSMNVVDSSACEGIDNFPTYADCDPSECGQSGGGDEDSAPTPAVYSYDYSYDGHGATNDGGGGSSGGGGGGSDDSGGGSSGDTPATTPVVAPVTSAPTRRPTPSPTKQPAKPTHSGTNYHKNHDDDGGARFIDDRVPTTPSPTVKDDWLSTVTGGGSSSSSGWKGSTGGGISSGTTATTNTHGNSPGDTRHGSATRTGGGMTAIMTFLGVVLSAITAFLGFHYYKRLNPSHCVDKIRYSKVPTQMDEFDEDQNFEFPEDRINPFEFHNESSEVEEKGASKGMHYTQTTAKVTPMATGDAVEMQPMGTAVNRDTGGSSPGPAVKGD